MARYKPQDLNSLLLPVVLSEQIVPGTFAFALNYLVDHELDLKPLDARFKNDEVGASAYDPRVMLKIVLMAYSQGLISSRAIEQACARNVQFIAISGDSQPSHTHIAKFVVNLGDQICAIGKVEGQRPFQRPNRPIRSRNAAHFVAEAEIPGEKSERSQGRTSVGWKSGFFTSSLSGEFQRQFALSGIYV